MKLRNTAITLFFLLSPIAIADDQKTFSDSKSINLVYEKYGADFRKRLEGTSFNPSYYKGAKQQHPGGDMRCKSYYFYFY